MSPTALPRPGLITAAASVVCPALPVVARLWIRHRTAARLHQRLESVAPAEVALVPGCAVHGDSPSPMLADRLATALLLVRLGRVDRVLVSGDAHHRRGDEAAVMARWLRSRGLEEDHLLVDPGARRTRETMQRARQRFGLRDVVVCTQRFHLPRAVYLADGAGLQAQGLVADRRRYRRAATTSLRELAAETKAFLEELA